MGSPASSVAATAVGASAPSAAFCAGVAGASMRLYTGAPKRSVSALYASPGSVPVLVGHLGREQAGDDAVLVRRPGLSHRSAGTTCPRSLPRRTPPSRRGALDEPLEAHRHLVEPAPEVGRQPILHARGHERLADGRVGTPLPRTAEEVGGSGSEIVIGVEQPDRGRDHAEAIGVGVVAEGEIEVAAHPDQPGHGVRATRGPCGSCRPSRGS